MEKPKKYYANTYHHLYNRGANRSNIFFDDNDYQYFLRKVNKYKEKYSINILCYCLLPNHFHLFAKQLTNDFTVGKFVGDLANSFTKGMNKKYNRNGTLFQGKTKSKLVDDESYFIWLCKYILNNPVKAELVAKPENWKYSSAKKYFEIAEENISDINEIKNRFKSIDTLKQFIKMEEKKFDYSVLF